MKRFAENSLVELVQRALGIARDATVQQPITDAYHTTSIRIPDDIKNFLEIFGKELGLSWQQSAIFALRAVMNTNTNTIPGIYQRILEIFEWHGLDAVDGCELLHPWGFTLDILADPNSTLHRISNSLIEFLTTRFQIPRAYLLNQSDLPQERTGNWYKNVTGIAQHILNLRIEGKIPEVLFLSDGSDKSIAFEKGDNTTPVQVGIAISIQEIVPHSDRTYRRYEFYGVERWNYWRSRYDLKHLCKFLEAIGGSSGYRGVTLTQVGLSSVTGQKMHIAHALEKHNQRSAWYPEDYILDNPNVGKETSELHAVNEEYLKSTLPSLVQWKMDNETAEKLKFLENATTR
jgi:hypothetical protein